MHQMWTEFFKAALGAGDSVLAASIADMACFEYDKRDAMEPSVAQWHWGTVYFADDFLHGRFSDPTQPVFRVDALHMDGTFVRYVVGWPAVTYVKLDTEEQVRKRYMGGS